MKKVNYFDVFKKMANEGLDIKASTNILSGKTERRGGIVTVGVDSETIQNMLTDDVILVLYVVNRNEYNKTKEVLENELH